jgi:Group II intron, maturase-specific domain
VANDDSNLRPVRAQLAEPPYADPHVRWCGRGGRATVPPMPIAEHVRQLGGASPLHNHMEGEVARCKERVRELASRKRGISLVRMVHDLAEYLRGWNGYFGRCETPEVLDKLEKWPRRRLRSMVWKQWKRGTTRYRELWQRGIAAQDAAQTAGSSDGPWHLANTPALKAVLSNAYFASFGLPELTAYG